MNARRWWLTLTWLLFGAGIVALFFTVRSSWSDAADEISSADTGLVIAAVLVLAAGRGLLALIAWVTAARTLARVHRASAAIAWMRSAVGKYIPGGLWQPVSAVGFLRHGGASTTSAATVVLFDMAASVVGGVLVGLLALPGLIFDDSGTAWWLLLALPMFAAMHPRVFRYGLRVAQRLTGRGHAPPDVPASLVAIEVSLQVAGWILAGVSLGPLFRALDAPIGWEAVIPAASISWVLGFLVLVAPAGLGVRELALVLLLDGLAPTETVIAAAVLSRVAFIVVDLASAAASLVIRTEGEVVV